MWNCENCGSRNWDNAISCHKCNRAIAEQQLAARKTVETKAAAERQTAEAEAARARDLTRILERLEVFEERTGVRLDALYAKPDGNSGWTINGNFESGIRINGEVHPREGTSLTKSLKVVADAYDDLGRLICTTDHFFNAETFFGFATFSLLVGGVPTKQITKIRIYPKVGW